MVIENFYYFLFYKFIYAATINNYAFDECGQVLNFLNFSQQKISKRNSIKILKKEK